MSATPAPDRLAVWTYEEAGEEIPHGDPCVTDAERSAAGRETITARWQALLPGNRSRAAARYAAGGLPEDQDVMRVWQPRDPAGLRARLTEPPLAVWAEDDVLHVMWQGQADEVWLGGGVQPRLWPVPDTRVWRGPRAPAVPAGTTAFLDPGRRRPARPGGRRAQRLRRRQERQERARSAGPGISARP